MTDARPDLAQDKPQVQGYLLRRGIFSLTHSPPGQNGRHFADEILRCLFENEKFWILIKISRKFVPKSPIHNNPALV